MKGLKRISLLCLFLTFIGIAVQKRKSYATQMRNTSIMYFLNNAGNFNQFVSLLIEAQVDGLLSKNLIGTEGGFTVFAPTDKAFFDFGQVGLLRGSSSGTKQAALGKLIKYHVIVGKQLSEKDLKPGNRFQTLAGENLEVNSIGTVEYAVKVSNGTVFVISKILINPVIKNLFPVLPTPAPGQAGAFSRYTPTEYKP